MHSSARCLTCQVWGLDALCRSCGYTRERGRSLQSTCVPFLQAELRCASAAWHSLLLAQSTQVRVVVTAHFHFFFYLEWYALPTGGSGCSCSLFLLAGKRTEFCFSVTKWRLSEERFYPAQSHTVCLFKKNPCGCTILTGCSYSVSLLGVLENKTTKPLNCDPYKPKWWHNILLEEAADEEQWPAPSLCTRRVFYLLRFSDEHTAEHLAPRP